MPTRYPALLLLAAFAACKPSSPPPALLGTWQLISATSTEKDSTYSTFNPDVRMIKIITPTHFSFLSHSLKPAQDSTRAAFTAGGGTYTLRDSVYTEHLEYFVDPQWENHQFEFVVTIHHDTLTQKGVEKLEALGIDRVIVERYKRVQ
jgi:hypothetical protein